MRLLVIGYRENTIAIVSSIEMAIAKVRDWNPSAIISNEIPTDMEDDDLTGLNTTLLQMLRDDGSTIKWWIKSIKAYL